jgi:uncharacterized protein
MRVINLGDLGRLASYLADQVRADGFAPDLIVCVESAGWPIGLNINEHFGAQLESVRAERVGKRMKQRLGWLLRSIPASLRAWLRALEQRANLHGRMAERSVQMDVVELSGKRILIVDDAVDTGHTIREVIGLLETRGACPEDIRVAAITQTMPSPAVAPHFVLFHTICSFPWSEDHPEREACRREYAR